MSLTSAPASRLTAAGQRISEYENAMTPPTPKKALGFKVVKRPDALSDAAIRLEDFPNEILTQIFSHLHSDSHAAIALTSKQFYALITSSHAWRMAFLRYFPGHEALDTKTHADMWAHTAHDFIQSEARYFCRLTPLASWRKEYLLRTRLTRSLARGKPSVSSGGIGSSIRTGKKTAAVLTYNSKLPWLVTNIHVVFSNGRKPPRAMHGAADLGCASISDPTNGRVEKWGASDPFRALQLDEIMPQLVPYGLGDGPAATPNVLDVSLPYGILTGEGFPGGRPYFRGSAEGVGRYLVADSSVVDTYPDIPKIPEMSQSICSVWIAKSSAVPSNTDNMIGMLVGSTLGVITSYAIGGESGGPRHRAGEITARWILSPGVPIVSIKVDDNYNQKRKTSARVWAVALNALGEVYYLTEAPASVQTQIKGEDVTKNAWYAGRSVYWHLIDSTRRMARADDLDKNATKGAYSPRSPSNSMNLSKGQLTAEAREIEKFLRHKPSHFRRVCQGWDMQRKLEVDFASDDGFGAGEHILVIDCGLVEGCPAHIQRYTRSTISQEFQNASVILAPTVPSAPVQPSLFGPVEPIPTEESVAEEPAAQEEQLAKPPSPALSTCSDAPPLLHEWDVSALDMKSQPHAVITCSAYDCSSNATLTMPEDPLVETQDEIPGRRSRLFAVGTDYGTVLVWNGRQDPKTAMVAPVRFIDTESPEISSVALTALYLVHGGIDGLVQAWDPLASTMEPVRTINAKTTGRVPRHFTTMNPTLRDTDYCAVGAIHLDPDATILRGVVSFGALLRYWTYSSTSHGSGRRRRLRHSDVHGRLASRRQGGGVTGFIAGEEAELRRENELQAREQNRLRNRFGVGALGDLTEEEALRYAQMVSEEAYLFEQPRTSDSAADASLDTASTFSETTVDTVTPEPSVTDTTPPPATAPGISPIASEEDDYEQQIQQAIRLSLMEGVNENVQSPPSDNHDFPVTYKIKPNKKNKPLGSNSPAAWQTGSSSRPEPRDDDLELALKLSMQEQDMSFIDVDVDLDAGLGLDEAFPSLDTEGVGKGKGVQRW